MKLIIGTTYFDRHYEHPRTFILKALYDNKVVGIMNEEDFVFNKDIFIDRFVLNYNDLVINRLDYKIKQLKCGIECSQKRLDDLLKQRNEYGKN